MKNLKKNEYLKFQYLLKIIKLKNKTKMGFTHKNVVLYIFYNRCLIPKWLKEPILTVLRKCVNLTENR